jgi:hypothetical protein
MQNANMHIYADGAETTTFSLAGAFPDKPEV